MSFITGRTAVPTELIQSFNGTAIITGANTGVGEQVARALAEMARRVVLCCRNTEKGEGARQRILSVHPAATVEVEELDLSSLSSVRGFVKRWKEREDQTIELLCCNAGGVQLAKNKTEDGHEATYQINALSHHLLAMELLPSLALAERPRIVYTCSKASFRGKIDFEAEDTPELWNGWCTAMMYVQQSTDLTLQRI